MKKAMIKRLVNFLIQEDVKQNLIRGEAISITLSALLQDLRPEIIHFGFVMLIGLCYPAAVFFGKKILNWLFPDSAAKAADLMDKRINGREEPPVE